MSENKLLGIWMDHSVAHLMDYSKDPVVSSTIESAFTNRAKDSAIGKSEQLMHNKEQHQQSDYYSALGEVIKNYSNVVLFGPTSAKNELFNVLKKDQHFGKIKIEIMNTDKMTENQRLAFAKQNLFK
ncbi:MAG: hypothetical protein IPP51_05570 [Bacteroidetes bacterium]|nr:hypothetical protein [Bacteroidota bacterium]